MDDDEREYLLLVPGALQGYAELSTRYQCSAMRQLHVHSPCILDMVGPLLLVIVRVRRLAAACLAQHGLLLGFLRWHVGSNNRYDTCAYTLIDKLFRHAQMGHGKLDIPSRFQTV